MPTLIAAASKGGLGWILLKKAAERFVPHALCRGIGLSVRAR